MNKTNESAQRRLLNAFIPSLKEQRKWDDYGPVSGTPEDAHESDMKADGNMDMNHTEMKHDH